MKVSYKLRYARLSIGILTYYRYNVCVYWGRTHKFQPRYNVKSCYSIVTNSTRPWTKYNGDLSLALYPIPTTKVYVQLKFRYSFFFFKFTSLNGHLMKYNKRDAISAILSLIQMIRIIHHCAIGLLGWKFLSCCFFKISIQKLEILSRIVKDIYLWSCKTFIS